jgi:cholesterol transport system auxiliary component
MRMGIMRKNSYRFSVLLLSLGLSGCGLLKPINVTPIKTYTLDPSHVSIQATQPSNPSLAILVQTPRAIPGFRTNQMVYRKQNFAIGYDTYTQWAGTPSDMLQPLIAQALKKTHGYKSVIVPPYTSKVDIELHTQVLSFYQDFRSHPSRFHLHVSAQLIDHHSKQVIATKDFNLNQSATADTPYGGVIAANQAVGRFLTQLSQFCTKYAFPHHASTLPATNHP